MICLLLLGNRLSDVGLENLCEVAATIPNVSSLNLACNDITHVGLKTLADCLQVVPSDGKKTPFQVTYFGYMKIVVHLYNAILVLNQKVFKHEFVITRRQLRSTNTVTPRYNAVVGRHLFGTAL